MCVLIKLLVSFKPQWNCMECLWNDLCFQPFKKSVDELNVYYCKDNTTICK